MRGIYLLLVRLRAAGFRLCHAEAEAGILSVFRGRLPQLQSSLPRGGGTAHAAAPKARDAAAGPKRQRRQPPPPPGATRRPSSRPTRLIVSGEAAEFSPLIRRPPPAADAFRAASVNAHAAIFTLAVDIFAGWLVSAEALIFVLPVCCLHTLHCFLLFI